MIYRYKDGITEQFLDNYIKAGLEPLLVKKYNKEDKALRCLSVLECNLAVASEQLRDLLRGLAPEEESKAPLTPMRITMACAYNYYQTDLFKIVKIYVKDAKKLLSMGVPASATLKTLLEGDELDVSNQASPTPIDSLSAFIIEGTRLTTTIEAVDAILGMQKKGIFIPDKIKNECWEVLLLGRTERRLAYNAKSNNFFTYFPYDKGLIDFVKGIPSSNWNSKENRWELKKTEWVVKHLNAMLQHFFFFVEPDAKNILTQDTGEKNGRITVSKTKYGYNALFQFDYCPDTIHALKKIGAKWDKNLNKWRMPVLAENKSAIVEFSKDFNFKISDKLGEE